MLRPGLLPVLVRSVWRFRVRAWYRRFPFLPVPPREYLDWRVHTAYGDGDRVPAAEEVERYLRWADRMARRRAGSRGV